MRSASLTVAVSESVDRSRTAKPMVSYLPTGVGTALVSSPTTTVSVETVPLSTSYGAYAVVSSLGTGDRSGGSSSWMQPLRTAWSWEMALVAVLFLLIGVLVALRATEVLSERDVDIPFRSTVTGVTNEPGETDRSQPDDHSGYERYLSPETPPELLSDEGKVVRLLVANDGYVRQHQIADETGWSKSKVSRICSQMHAEGTIEKRSIGRENVITLAEVELDEYGSDDVENPFSRNSGTR